MSNRPLLPSLSGPVLVLGSQGQVGSALLQLLKDQAIGLTRQEVDLSSPGHLQEVISYYKPAAILNSAAYTQVDKAESEPELALLVNGKAPAELARYCQKQQIPLVHFSTDYVFNGSGKIPWKETDMTAPLSVYGDTKRRGEQAIEESGGRYLILRTSWVYDAWGKNFLKTMLRLGQEKEVLSIVNDQYGAPTYAPTLALKALEALAKALEAPQFPSGIYHLCHQGETTWYHFATEIFSLAKQKSLPIKVKEIKPIETKLYPTPAVRPLNSRLNCSKIAAELGIEMPDWQQSLKECMEHIP